MAEPASAVDLRLTIPGAEPYRAIAGQLAEKLAEFVGARKNDAQHLREAVGADVADLAAADGAGNIDLLMARNGKELVVTATAGSATRRSACPLPD